MSFLQTCNHRNSSFRTETDRCFLQQESKPFQTRCSCLMLERRVLSFVGKHFGQVASVYHAPPPQHLPCWLGSMQIRGLVVVNGSGNLPCVTVNEIQAQACRASFWKYKSAIQVHNGFHTCKPCSNWQLVLRSHKCLPLYGMKTSTLRLLSSSLRVWIQLYSSACIYLGHQIN